MTDHQRSPLGWTAGKYGPDVLAHLNNAKMLSDILMSVDGHKNLGTLPEDAVCTLTIMISQEISAANQILEQGDVSST